MSTESLKKVNLEHIQKPKTLIVIHYKGKRVSIPLFHSVDNISDYLWQQLKKFENAVLEKEGKSNATLDVNKIVGFSSFEADRNKFDIKMNILLSFSRLSRDYGRSRSDLLELDITNYYKYLEIEPYYGFNSNELIPEYQLYSVLSTGSYYTVYLGRRLSDGRFFTVKIVGSESKVAYNEYTCMKRIYHKQEQFENKRSLELIPEVEEVRKGEGVYIFIYEYCPGGTLANCLTRKLNEIECLHYMKQLVWGVYTLHTQFNLIHRAVCCENLEVDFVGNLRLVNFCYCQPCYSSFSDNSIVTESYNERYEIENVRMPPEVQRSSAYNNLVDFYGVGAVLSQIYNIQPNENYVKKSRDGIESAFENLMADNIKEREFCVNEIISEFHEEKMRESSSSSKRSEVLEYERLTLNTIYFGDSIKLDEKPKNGIKHEDALKIMKPSHDDQFESLNPIKNKTKNKSKSKDKKEKSKSKKKSTSKDNLIGKDKSTSVKSIEKGQNKKESNKSEKSLNKSIDSSKHSVKSKDSKGSISKIPKPKNPTVTISKSPPISSLIPKSPTSGKNDKFTVKSPNRQTVKSPTKLLANSIRNRF